MRVHHLAFRTHDLARLEGFYSRLLGMSVRARQTHGVWLEAGETILMLEQAAADEPTTNAASMELVAFEVGLSEAATVEARLLSAGVTIESRTKFTAYFRDPDGRRIGLSHYPHEP